MTISSGLNAALAGVNKGLRDMVYYAGKVSAAAGGSAVDSPALTEALIGLKGSERQVKASVKLVEAFDETLGTLLDEKV